MSQSIGTALRSFWHTMTSYDRHASHDSPFRTGQHVPLPQSRNAPLTSVATNASESRVDLSETNGSTSDLPKGPNATTLPYSPGMRTMLRRQSEDATAKDQIQMQNFSEGLPPPPPVSHSWKRMERWSEDNYEELWDNLSEPCTQNDINELEHVLDCTLPMEVRESLQVHDGQERGGLPTGIIFGCMLLDCEEIVQEWQNWRTVNEDFLNQPTVVETPRAPSKSFAGPSSSNSHIRPPTPQRSGSWREDLAARQDSQPPNAVQKVYAHPAWIPLARDWGGNCLAVDLAPGPAGKWGQIIIMGRDYDCKYVVARSWAAFLANVADDMTSKKVFVDEDTGELKLREFKQQGVEPPYLGILRWRVDQKYGRKGPRRRPMPGELRVNSNVAGGASRASPYASPISANPVSGDPDRGRSPQRFPMRNGISSSPRSGIYSPLARVAEEVPAAIEVHSEAGSRKNSVTAEKLVPIDSNTDAPSMISTPPPEEQSQVASPIAKDKESRRSVTTGLGVKQLDADAVAESEGMKTVEL